MNAIVLLALTAFSAPPAEIQATADTRLYVRTRPPGAKVIVDGKTLGFSNDLFDIEPGVRRIIIELDGYHQQDKVVTIQTGKIKRLVLKLKKQRAASRNGVGGGGRGYMSGGGGRGYMSGGGGGGYMSGGGGGGGGRGGGSVFVLGGNQGSILYISSGGGYVFGGGRGDSVHISGSGRERILWLLTYSEVKEDLKLDEQQQEQIEKFIRESLEFEMEIMEVLSGPPNFAAGPLHLTMMRHMARAKKDIARVEKNNAKTVKKIEYVLTPAQQQRLKQISLQVQPADVLFEPEIIKKLGITPAQKKRLAAIRQKAGWMSHAVISQVRSGRAEIHDQIGQKIAKIQGQAERQMLTQLLNDRQRAKLKELQGDTLDLKNPTLIYSGSGSDGSAWGFSSGFYGGPAGDRRAIDADATSTGGSAN